MEKGIIKVGFIAGWGANEQLVSEFIQRFCSRQIVINREALYLATLRQVVMY